VILSDVRDKLYNTCERSRGLLSSGHSDVPEEATLTSVEQVEIYPWSSENNIDF
jgi:phosphoenolpyruvate carboxylase